MDDALILRDSASSTGDASSVGTTGALGSTVLAPVDLVHAYGVMDRASYQQLVGVVTTQLRVTERAVSFQCGSLRVSSGQSATSRSISGSSVSAGAVSERKSKLASIRRASSWRTKTLPHGLCYLGMLRDSDAQHVGERLGQWPTLASILKTSASSFKSLQDLDSFRLTGDDGGAHVSPFGAGTSLLPSFARVAQGLKLAPGTFGAVLRASAVRPDASALRVTARTPVGGEVVVSGMKTTDGRDLRWHSGPIKHPQSFVSSDSLDCDHKLSFKFSSCGLSQVDLTALVRKVTVMAGCVPQFASLTLVSGGGYAKVGFSSLAAVNTMISSLNGQGLRMLWREYDLRVSGFWHTVGMTTRLVESTSPGSLSCFASVRFSYLRWDSFATRVNSKELCDLRDLLSNGQCDVDLDSPGSLSGVYTLRSADSRSARAALKSLLWALSGAGSLQVAFTNFEC